MDWGTRITYLASTALKERTTPFGIKDIDRTNHVCVLGKVGTGRAALLARMALQDIERGIGTVILDASGNLGPLIIERLDAAHRERLIHLDAADAEYPFVWDAAGEFRGSDAAKEMFAILLPGLYGIQRSPLTDFVSAYVMKTPGKSVLELFNLVTDEKYRTTTFAADTPEAKELAALLESEKESVPVISESGRYLAKDTMVRNLIGQTETKFTLGTLAEGGVVIVDMSRIRVFPTRITPLVRLFAYAARASVQIHGTPAGLYMHDCLRYLSESDADYFFGDHSLALSLSDTIYRESDMILREKSLSRCGSVISFQPHQADMGLVQKTFYPYMSPEDLTGLEAGEAAVALSIDGIRSKPFFAQVLPLQERQNISLQDVYSASRQKYTSTRQKVDQQFKKPVDEDKDKNDPGSFSDAFKTIFNKKPGSAGALPPGFPLPPKPAGPQAPVAPKPEVAAEPVPPPAPTTAPEPKKVVPKEVAEEDLRQLLYVGPVPA